MSIDLNALRTALVNALDSITEATADGEDTFEGVSLRFYFANRATIEKERPGFGARLMVSEYLKASKPHEYVPWGQGVLPEQSGTGDNWIAKYADYKPMWQNAEQAGEIEPIVRLIPHGEAAFLSALRAMYASPWGQAWLADERTVGMRPKSAP